MPLVLDRGRALFFAHVPKTGGTSVEDYLVQRFGRLGMVDVNKRRGVRGTGLITPATHLAAIDLAELLPPGLDWSFALVRDPLDRIQSEYRYQTGVSRMSRMGFSTWLETVLRAAEAEPRVYENHLRPQVDLIPEDAEIFRLEDGFDALIARLDAVVGEARPDLTIPHMNKRPKAPLALTRSDVARIASFYAADYARLGYAVPDPGAWPEGPGPNRLLARALAPALVARQRRRWTA